LALVAPYEVLQTDRPRFNIINNNKDKKRTVAVSNAFR